jgi:hypothetical protein
MNNDPSRSGHHLRGKVMTSDDTLDVWGRTSEQAAAMQAGNAMIARARDSVAGTLGTSGRTGEPTPTDPVIRDRLSTALTESEQAKRGNDPDRVAYAEHALDKAIAASRQSREGGGEQARDESGQFTSFDGGVRGGPQRKPTPGGSIGQTPGEALRNLVDVSKEAQRELNRERPVSELGLR